MFSTLSYAPDGVAASAPAGDAVVATRFSLLIGGSKFVSFSELGRICVDGGRDRGHRVVGKGARGPGVAEQDAGVSRRRMVMAPVSSPT
jgi:hypothetical protein